MWTFFLGQEFSVVRRLGESVFVFTLGSSSSNDMKLENGKFRCIIHYLRLSNASINVWWAHRSFCKEKQNHSRKNDQKHAARSFPNTWYVHGFLQAPALGSQDKTPCALEQWTLWRDLGVRRCWSCGGEGCCAKIVWMFLENLWMAIPVQGKMLHGGEEGMTKMHTKTM